MSTFPLLRLPSLAIEAVFKFFRTFDVMNFSRVSRNSRCIAIYYCEWRKLSLRIYAQEYLMIRMESWDPFEYAISMDVESDGRRERYWESSVSEKEHPHRECVYSETPLEKLKELTTEIMQIFRCSIQVVEINTNNSDVYKMVDWLKSVSNTFEKCLIVDDENNSEALEYILENIKPAKRLFLWADNHTDRVIEKIPKNLKYTSLWKCTLGQLKKLEGEEIILTRNRLSLEDVITFLKSWLAMESHLNLKAFETVITSVDQVDTILRDIPHEVADLAKVQNRAWDAENLIGAYDITRDDGTIATVYTKTEGGAMFGLYVPPREEVDES